MKRISALIAALLILASTAIAEMDLSGMTLDELVELHEQLNLILFEQAKSVTIPQGIWLVGKDIPAGTYLIRCADLGRDSTDMRYCLIRWGKSKPTDEGKFEGNDRLGDISIYNPNNKKYQEGGVIEYIATFENGMYIFIMGIHNKAVFYQYTGPNFTFDW